MDSLPEEWGRFLQSLDNVSSFFVLIKGEGQECVHANARLTYVEQRKEESFRFNYTGKTSNSSRNAVRMPESGKVSSLAKFRLLESGLGKTLKRPDIQ